MKQVRQHFANTESGNLVEIHSTHKGDGHVYYCPYCRQELIPKRGEYNEWHFAHKLDSKVECSHEQYLHSLAIKEIYCWYQSTEKVNIRLCNTHKCSITDCRWKTDACERQGFTDSINLKSLYETAEVEKEFETASGIFRADIMLSSTKYPNDPIFLEFCVTHACTPEKIASGLRIIEFKINTEDDIERIITSNVIQEYRNSCNNEDENYSGNGAEHNLCATFYGFKSNDKLIDGISQSLQKFILYPSQNQVVINTTCRDYHIRKGIWEVTSLDRNHFYTIQFFHACLSKAFHLGYVQRTCKLCKYMGIDKWMDDAEVCNLSRKFGTKRYCKDNDETSCQYFRVDEERLNSELMIFDKFKDKCKFDIWGKFKKS